MPEQDDIQEETAPEADAEEQEDAAPEQPPGQQEKEPPWLGERLARHERKILRALGVKTLDEAKGVAEEFRKLTAEKKSDAERQQEELQALRTAVEEAAERAGSAELQLAVVYAGLKQGVPADRLDDLYKLLDIPDTEDELDMAALVKEAVAKRPWLLSGDADSSGNGSTTHGARGRKTGSSKEQDSRVGQLLELAGYSGQKE